MGSEAERAKNPEEFRSYRQALWIAYVSVGGLGSLLLVASVVAELFGGRGQKPQAPSPTDLLQCSDDVLLLLEDLADTPADLMHEAAHGAQVTELGEKWELFSHEWDGRWETVNVQCRFDELADTGLGPAFDRMAWVHRNLPRLKLKYRETMKRFTDDQAETLVEMRAALERSRRLLHEQAETPPPSSPPPR